MCNNHILNHIFINLTMEEVRRHPIVVYLEQFKFLIDKIQCKFPPPPYGQQEGDTLVI